MALPPIRGLPARITDRVRPADSGCWEWEGAHTTAGYAETFLDRKVRYAHRVLYEAARGPIPAGLTIDHLCRNPGCVNPAHLEAVTMRENLMRGTGPAAHAARATACPQGHPYDEANTIREGRHQTRRCRACKREATKKWHIATRPDRLAYMREWYRKRKQEEVV